MKISPPPRGVRRSSSHVPFSISLLTAALVRLGATRPIIPIWSATTTCAT